MNDANLDNAHAKILSALCVFVLGCILVVGLWPFHVPRNAVDWLENKPGLRFSKHGAVVSAGAFRTPRRPDETGFTLELCLTPARTIAGGAILAFDSSPDPRAPFKLSQFGTSLAIQRYFIDQQGKVQQFWFKVPAVFEANKTIFLTITSNKNKTDLYLDGNLKATSLGPGITSRELAGRLVLGNSTVDDSWRGAIETLAISRQEWTADQVNNHFQRWVSNQDLSASERSMVALYRFNERQGSTIHNQVDSETNLIIPARYFVLHKSFLRQDLYPQTLSTWQRSGTWQDLGINVGGFIPVGFVFCAYFSSVKRIPQVRLSVILMGFLLSLVIETSQWLLPNRDSGMADLVTNTTGTAIGVLLYQCPPLHALWNRILKQSNSVLERSSVWNQFSRSPLPPKDEKATFSGIGY